jgi:hypothetical protein
LLFSDENAKIIAKRVKMDAAAHKYEFMYGAQFRWRVAEQLTDTDQHYSVICSLHNLG